MKSRCVTKTICMLVVIALLLSNIGYAYGDDNIVISANDPFEHMVDLIDDASVPATLDIGTDDSGAIESVQEYMQRVQGHKEAQKKTDRYIVKYKTTSSETQFKKKLGNAIKDTTEMQAVVSATSTASLQRTNIVQTEINNMEVIVLDEPAKPTEFATQLESLGLEDTIEYIQPDFLLYPEDISMEITEVGEEISAEDAESVEGNSEFEEITSETTVVTTPEVSEKGETLIDNTEIPQESDSAEDIEETQTSTEETENTPEETVSEEVVDENIAEILPSEDEIVLEEITGESIIVAVIDTGADVSHELIADYVWTGTSGIKGWNLIEQNGNIYDEDNPVAYAHGTHISSVIAQAARENNASVEIMNLKAFEDGSAYTSDVIAAIEYAEAQGAKIINCSFGGTNYNQALYDAIATTDALFVCAAGNNRMNLNETPIYPACFELENIISVASVNEDGGFSYFSNYGPSFIDIAALGKNVLGAYPGGGTYTNSGTSIAGAAVSGAAAVVLSENEALNIAALKARLINTADKLPNLENKIFDGRRLNLNNAIANQEGEEIMLNPENDFDVHQYVSPTEELRLFSEATPVSVSAGAMHSLILMSDGSVWAFGNGYNGSLGDGNLESHVVPYTNPVRVIGLPTNIRSIHAGGYHNLALTHDGYLYAWGDNTFSQLGNYSWSGSVAMQLSLANVSSCDVGESHSLATTNYYDYELMEDYVYTYFWGDNSQGQIGMGTTATVNYPQTGITTSTNTWLYGTGGQAGKDFTIITAITEQGGYPAKYYSTGDNSKGQLGNGSTTSINKFKTTNVSKTPKLGGNHGGYIVDVWNEVYGDVYLWGSNEYGQLGPNAGSYKTSPYRVYQGSATTAKGSYISLGENHTYIKLSDGTLLKYGRNDLKQLDCGDLNFTSIVSGYNHNLGFADGKLWVWGANTDKQIADTDVTAYDPVEVSINTASEIVLTSSIDSYVVEYTETSGELVGQISGEVIDLTTATFTVQADDPTIVEARVEIVDNKAMIFVEGLREGETDIEIVATANGVNGTLIIPMMVIGDDYAELSVTSNIPAEITNAQSVSAPVELTINGTTMDLSEEGTVVTASSNAPDVASATVTTVDNQPTLTVTGTTEGDATITVSVTFRSKVATTTIPVSVTVVPEATWSGVNLIYDFGSRPPFVNDDDMTQLTEYNMALDNNGLVRNTNWKYLDSYNLRDGREARNYYGAAFSNGLVADGWVAFMLQIPESGKYVADIEYHYHAGAASADMYILKASDVISEEEDLGNAIGQAINAANPNGTIQYTVRESAQVDHQCIGEVEIPESGEYILVLKAKDAGVATTRAGAYAMTIDKLVLNGALMETLQFVLDSNVVSQNNSVTTYYKALTSVGAPVDLRFADIIYTSGDTSIVQISENGVVTAVADGKTTVSITVTLDGISKTVTKPIRCDMDAETTTTYVSDSYSTIYDFVGDCDELSLAVNQAIDHLTDYSLTEGNSNWAYYARKNFNAPIYHYSTIRTGRNTSDLAWQAFRINVPKSGWYTAKMSYSRHYGCQSVAFYIFPAGTTADAITDKLTAGSVQPFGILEYVTGTEITDELIGDVFIPFVGDNIFVMKVNVPGTDTIGAGTSGLHISNLKFEGTALPPIVGEKIISKDVETGKEYYITIKGTNLTSFEDEFVFSYDGSVLEVIDMCAFVYSPITAIGQVGGTDIQITQIGTDSFTFGKEKTVPAGLGWSGVLNVVKVRAKATTQTEIEISTNMVTP